MRERGVTAVAMEVSSHALTLGRVDGVGLRRGGLHQPHPGPPRLPRRHGGVRGGQGIAVHAPARAARRRQPRRPGRPAAGRRSRAIPTLGLRRGRRLAGQRASRRAPRAAASGCAGPGVDLRRRRRSCPATTTSATPSPPSPRWSRRGSTRRPPSRASAALPGVPGRMERVDEGQAVPRRRRLRAHPRRRARRCCARCRAVTPGRVLVVLGCGGDRDRGKRPLMGPGRRRRRRRRGAHQRQPAQRGPARHPGRGGAPTPPARWSSPTGAAAIAHAVGARPARATASSSPARATRPARRSRAR